MGISIISDVNDVEKENRYPLDKDYLKGFAETKKNLKYFLQKRTCDLSTKCTEKNAKKTHVYIICVPGFM